MKTQTNTLAWRRQAGAAAQDFQERVMIHPRRKLALVALVACTLLGLGAAAVAQEHGRPGGRQEQGRQGGPGRQEENGPGVLSLLPADAISEHSIDTPGGKLNYTVTAGTFSLFDQSGERSAAVFYTAYVVKTANPANRPVTFVFNGGPGAASAFLNLGLAGPRLAEFGLGGHDGSNVRIVVDDGGEHIIATDSRVESFGL